MIDDHIVSERKRILRINPVVGSDEDKVESAVLVNLKLIVRDYYGWVWLNLSIRKDKADLYNITLMISHRYLDIIGAVLFLDLAKKAVFNWSLSFFCWRMVASLLSFCKNRPEDRRSFNLRRATALVGSYSKVTVHMVFVFLLFQVAKLGKSNHRSKKGVIILDSNTNYYKLDGGRVDKK